LTDLPLIAFVVPCYNEANRLDSKEFIQFCQTNPTVTFCFVDDGSKDSTVEVLRNLNEQNNKQLFYLQLPTNQGKAEAVRQGILHLIGQFDYVGYLDADLATPLSEIPNFIQIAVQMPDLLLIAGSRISRMGANIARYWFRHYFGRIFATVVSEMLKLRFYDTQCGAKLLKNNILNQIFDQPFLSPWLFDVELIFRLKQIKSIRQPEKYIYELPLHQWIEKGDSKIKLKDLLKIPYELWKIWKKYR
jgi:dolichyl-phosphate beta-glucosyltransferase